MSRRRYRERMVPNAEINVVNLIDVMLLLLVIFMLTAPMMTGGLDLTLPTADSKALETKSGLKVTIDRSGAVWVNDDKMTFSQFKGTFRTIANARGNGGVDLYIDKDTRYELVVQVMSVIKAAGVTDFGLVDVPQGIER